MNAPLPRRPNLVFVFTDQQSYDMLGCVGRQPVQTPSLDRFERAMELHERTWEWIEQFDDPFPTYDQTVERIAGREGRPIDLISHPG